MASQLTARPRLLKAQEGGRQLAERVKGTDLRLTVADVSARSGLALRDAERALQWALGEFRGHLQVTDKGELIYHLPNGFRRPDGARESARELARRVSATAWKGLQVVMKWWVLGTVVTYAATFALIVLGFTVASIAGQRDDDDDGPGGFASFWMWRLTMELVSDALYAASWSADMRRLESRRYESPRVPARRQAMREPPLRTYERVHQFIFGAPVKAADPGEEERRLLAVIRQRRGRVGVADVMEVTGLNAQDAEARITRLLVDFEGEIEISDEGGVFYVFRDVLVSTGPSSTTSVEPVWDRPVKVPALTGSNAAEHNLIIGGVNLFNLGMGAFAVTHHWTLENLVRMFTTHARHLVLDTTSAPLLLGWMPVAFSSALYAIPAVRALVLSRQRAKAAAENGRQAVLRAVLEDVEGLFAPDALARLFRKSAGRAPRRDELKDMLLRMGGETTHLDDGTQRWRFPDLARERRALLPARLAASAAEASAGAIVFDSEQ